MPPSTTGEVLAFHGWGFDHTCWDAWRPLFGDAFGFRAFDRGYFGSPQEVGWSRGGRGLRVLLAHSMGLLFCPPEAIERADRLVLFGGFEHFHPMSAEQNRRSRKVVARMRARLGGEPGEVLAAFHRNCGLSEPVEPAGNAPPRAELLGRDLELLDTERVDLAGIAAIPVVCMLHGLADRIVPEQLGAALHDALRRRPTYLPVSGAGHGLPFTHAGESWMFVRSCLGWSA